MHLNDSFVLRVIADEHLLIPTGNAALQIKGLLSLTESGAFLYRKLQTGCSEAQLLDALTSEYEVSTEEARADVAEFLCQMRQLDILLED